ncbi:uncharacterized protein [Lolium perenne]|uniref:uncharacterized protein n=1 Tax=Lolium perenne TaxID=4522 RepID=UPI0021F538DA|nr:uncharacterized protein LOC127318535 [Lolium perenne]
MDSKIVKSTTSRSGGVLLLWKRGINIQQIYAAPNYIDVSVHESPEKIWRLTGIYGEPKWEDKYKTWDKLRELRTQNNMPWVVIGDFNEILFSTEKEGGNSRPDHFMQAFRDALSDCNLHDLGFLGDPFTWHRGRIRERLDRAVADHDWLLMHPEATLTHLDCMKSDHRPILLETERLSVPSRASGPKRFEAKWLKEEGFREVVANAWTQAAVDLPAGGVLERLAHMHASLHTWDSDILRQPKRRLKSAQRKLERAMAGPLTMENEVDPELLDKIQPKVTPIMNDGLLAPFNAEEVKKAAFAIGDLKAPGPDGLHAIFYKRFWSICGESITSEILQALNTGVIPEGWNDTMIVLIPKVDNPESVTQYRPISLCNDQQFWNISFALMALCLDSTQSV